VTYDILAACHRYLHLVRFNETFGIGDIASSENFFDFLAKLGLLLGLYALVASILHTMFTLSSSNKDIIEPNTSSLASMIENTMRNTVWAALVFFVLIAHWRKHQYSGTFDTEIGIEHIQRAMVLSTVFFVTRAIDLVVSLLAWSIDFPEITYVPQTITLVYSTVLLMESSGIHLIDRLC
jgi:hypothetical protein